MKTKKVIIPFRIITKTYDRTKKVYFNMPDKNNHEMCVSESIRLLKKSGFKKTEEPFYVDIKYYIKGQKILTMEEVSGFFMDIFHKHFLMKKSQIRGWSITFIHGNEDWKVDVTISY